MEKTHYFPLRKEDIERISHIFKLISDPTRLEILFLLQEKERNVTTIAEALQMEQSAISHQLRTLKNSRLVKSERNGKQMIYSLDDLHVFSILEQALTHIKEKTNKME